MVLHKDLAGAELHENKGVAAAASGDVATANGSGVTVWKKIGVDSLDLSALYVNSFILSADFVDIGTAETIYLTAPFDGTLDWATLVIYAPTATTDTIITFKNSSGTTIDTITIPASSPAGTIFTASFGTDNIFTADGLMSIVTDGGSSTVSKAHITMGYTAA